MPLRVLVLPKPQAANLGLTQAYDVVLTNGKASITLGVSQTFDQAVAFAEFEADRWEAKMEVVSDRKD